MKPRTFEVTLNALVPRRLTDRSDCEAVLRSLCAYEVLAPEFFDVVEPIREPFDCRAIGAALDTVWAWQGGPDTFMWRRRKPNSWGGIYMSKTPEPVHGNASLHATAGSSELNATTIGFLTATAVALGTDFGMIDLTPRRPDGTLGSLVVTTWKLRAGLPDLYWGTVFGAPYVRLFGADRLRSAPVASCRELAPELFYLQLTDDLNDVVTRPDLVSETRSRCKNFLGIDAFADPQATTGSRRLPQFSLQA